MRVLVVSPHYDDAPLSLGQSMIDGHLAGEDVCVGIVFGRSNWTRWFQPTRARAPLATAIRRIEERRNAGRFGYRIRRAGLEEVVLREGTADTGAYLDEAFDPQTSPVRPQVAAVIRGWAARADLLLAPLGVGHHVDHRLCASAAAELEAEGLTVAFYEDRPYASSAQPEELEAAAAALGRILEPRQVSGAVTAEKTRRLWYPSQFTDLFVQAQADDVRRGRPERVWVPSGAAWPPPGPDAAG